MAYTIRPYDTKAGRRYEVRYRKPDGTPTGKRGFKRKMDADVWGAANVTTAKTTGAYIDPQAGRRRVEDFWEPWIAAKKTESKASTIDLIERVWRVHIEPKWGMREVQSITHDEVQVWISEMSMTKSASLVRRTTFTLRALLKKAKADKCIHENPCDDLALPRMVRKKHVYLTISQLLALADASGWHRPIILTLGLCGLRWGELVGLQVGDVDFTRQRIHIVRMAAEIRSRIVVDIPKTGETRTVIFPALLRPCLEDACRGRQPSELLFPDIHTGSFLRRPHGTRKGNWFYRAKRSALSEQSAGSMTIHDLRHTCASLLVHAGANVKAVQRQLGHKSAAMTLDVYADLFDDDLDAVGEAMNGLLIRAIGEGRDLAA
ncbi:tyrosine-type recombinase/integrase [Bifidobacterium dentium]|uniref:tyrosine-type recombinase/integrase n=1 Tax=Bifidobacterium dentium TaxID=1689 RepID=UPI003D182629